MGSELFGRAAFTGNHPLGVIRHASVLDLVRALDWLDGDRYCEVEPASRERLIEFHDPAYVDALQYADSEACVARDVRERFNIGTLENPLFPGVYARAAATVAGAIRASELALDGHRVFHPSGGTHHGRPDRAAGFCYFNDPVFAIRRLARGGCRRVAYVDLDAHHGDGVEAAFAGDPDVITLSIHEDGRWPHSGQASLPAQGIYNLPVPKGLHDAELDYLLEHAVLPLLEQEGADALVVCCGADCLAGDPLSSMRLSNTALWRAVRALLDLGVPSVVLGGGGYNPWTLARYWAGLWGVIADRPVPATLPPAATALLAAMQCDLVDDEDIEPAWLTSMADSPYTGPVRDTIKSLAAAAVTRRPGSANG